MTIVAVLMRAFDHTVATLFTTDEETVNYIKEVLPVLGVYLIFDTVHGVQSGNIRALGKQGIASFVTLVCYYAVGLPLAMYLGFNRHLNLVGFWEGFLIAIILLDIVVGCVTIFADWDFIRKQGKTAEEDNSFEDMRINDSRENDLREGLIDKQRPRV